jgi:hypothetical protein
MCELSVADLFLQDNDEFCASCSGEGKLLCCDGCTNSFHHACLEPPLNPDEEVDGEWYCPRCVARRTKEVPHPTGLLGMVLRRVEDIIPKAYALPEDVREYFEGVRTGEEGEYEEISLAKNRDNVGKMNRAGFIEEPNYKDTRDSKGNLILCYFCNQTSNGRDIIPCDFCPAKWHLDCCDPPLAVPPRRRAGDKPNASWRCPLHIESDLSAISRQADKAPGELGRIPKLRRPKNAISLDVPHSRGFRNNGIIEVELAKDELDFAKMQEVNMQGKVYRLPEQAIKLDFIDRVKKSWYEDHANPRIMGAEKIIRCKKYRPDNNVVYHPPTQSKVKVQPPDFYTGANALAITETARANAALRKKSLKEQQTVLSLARMSQKGIDGYSGDALAELTNDLISEAPDKVVRAAEKSEVDQLLLLQGLINKRLSVISGVNGSASKSTGQINGGRQAAAQDANIDPLLRDVAADTAPYLSPALAIDPSLQNPYTSTSRPVNGSTDGPTGYDADDEDLGTTSTTNKGYMSGKSKYRVPVTDDGVWRSQPPSFTPEPAAWPRRSVSNNGNGMGSGNGHGQLDSMELSP